MKTHWTGRSIKDYMFRIAADFIAQLEKKMESSNISQDKLAKKMGVTKGRVSQLLNHPGNMSLVKMIEYANALGTKVSIIAYEDDDPENIKGPIDSEIFRICWEKSGKPRDFWAVQDFSKQAAVAVNLIGSTIKYEDLFRLEKNPIPYNVWNLGSPKYYEEKSAYTPRIPGTVQ